MFCIDGQKVCKNNKKTLILTDKINTMKARSLFFAIPVLGFTLFSCNTMQPLLDDDVYMMKSADVPIGEELADETSYENYKFRVNADAPTSGYYDQRNTSVLNTQPMMLGSGWFAYGRFNNFGTLSYMSSPYWGIHRNGFYGYPGMGMYTPYYYGTGFAYGYPNYYNNGWFGSPNNYYGHYYNGGVPLNNANSGVFCYGLGNSNGTPAYYGSPTNKLGNFVSGPRATISGGYYSGTSRGGAAQVKSQTYTSSAYSNRPAVNNSRSTQRTPQYSRTTNRATNTRGTRTYSSTRSTTTNGTRSGSRGTVTTRSTSTRSSSSGTSRSTFRSGSSGSRSSSGSSGSSGGRSSGSGGSSRSGGRGN